MVGADILAGQDQGSCEKLVLQNIYKYSIKCNVSQTMTAWPLFNPVSTTANDILLGDGLVLVSATLYAISNVCQEYTVKNLSRVEFLGMVGLFGSIISAIQL